jgi:hypothetical protein
MKELSELLGLDNASLLSGALLAFSFLLMLVTLSATAAVRQALRDARRLAEQCQNIQEESERWFAAHREQIRALRSEIDRLQARPSPLGLGSGVGSGPGPASASASVFSPAPGTASVPASPPEKTAAPAPSPAAPFIASRPAKGLIEEGEATILVGLTPAERSQRDDYHGMPMLRATSGSDTGRVFVLSFGNCTIGRASGNTAVITEAKASRTHAEILFQGGKFTLRDNRSTNGTLKNGEAVTTPCPLEFGDVITIGGSDLVFSCEGFDLRTADPTRAIIAFERLLDHKADFIPALHHLAFLLERDVARRHEAAPIWERLKKLES